MGIAGGSLTPDRKRILLERSSDNAIDAAVDGSVTPQLFVYEIPAGQEFRITEVALEMGLTSAPGPDQFGNVAALTNGFEIYAAANEDLTTPLVSLFADNNTLPKTNMELVVEATDYAISIGRGAGSADAEQTWRFRTLETQDIWKGGPIPAGLSMVMRINDDLSSFLGMFCRMSGLLSTPRNP